MIGKKSVEKKNIFRGVPLAVSPDCVGHGVWLSLSLCRCGATVTFLPMIAGYPKRQKLSAKRSEENPVFFRVFGGSRRGQRIDNALEVLGMPE